jgi:hypothetical protein
MHTPSFGCTTARKISNPPHMRYHLTPMRLLRYIAAGFINFFSITAPAPGQENRAALYIFGMLTAVALFVVVAVSLAVHILRH